MDDDTYRAKPPPFRRVEVAIPIRRKPKVDALPYSSNQTGIVYDVRMRFHTEPIDALLDEDDIHPEDPRRILEIFQELAEAGLVETPGNPVADVDFALWRINARPATEEEICLVHSKKHYDWVKSLPHNPQELLNEMSRDLDSVYLHPTTYFCATLSAGGAIEAARAVVAQHVKNAVAVIRPPGHHAEHNQPGGFCFFNNVCVAARVCQQDFPMDCRKILILDWDVHHGNGVQQAFYNDPNVLYISMHVHKNGTFYPATTYGDHHHNGEGPGLGRNVNIPWCRQGMGDGDYMYAFQQVVMPIAVEFDPDLVIVSAGFDAAEGDRLGQCHVTPPCYAHMTHMLMSLARGKIVVCLEGGYNLRSIAKSALAVTRTLMGEPPDRLGDIEPSRFGYETVELVKRTQSPFWKCMSSYRTIDQDYVSRLKPRRMHDIVRANDSEEFFQAHRMTELCIIRDRISTSFQKQVLATQDFDGKRPLLVIFHEPPETTVLRDPQSDHIDLHNIFVTDVTKTYVEWAVENHFGVIDVNIPKYITDLEGPAGYVEADDPDKRAHATKELASYLWENYIELGENTSIFFMGVGAAYAGIIDLLGENDHCTDAVKHCIAFLADNPLQSIKKLTDDYIGNWYHAHSTIFVSDTHGAWDPSRQRKLRKKYGNLIRSPQSDIPNMLEEHRSQVIELLLEETEEWREEHARELEEDAERQEKARLNAAAHERNNALLSAPLRGLGDDRDGHNGHGSGGAGNNGVRSHPTSAPSPATGVGRTSTPTRAPPLGMFSITPSRGSASPSKRPRTE
ncbi:uncharacterized protein K452DRAFT_220067 [Aplosporella prunicola CBS 121167]|uniref:Histone deacetylase n=1 Tax=Aplosporella prunicola CBS 121167 TaxID=1176127 RepID=A0A6A6BPC1_9PEZI|nr:uncharacterized protein K452DRAFT_220067 [Aplosporella prunicola CBS 121167]KAF2145942.1 hypothetical protein K452DRAFT_220067 [Aplosporella prunicola CBS 121167]